MNDDVLFADGTRGVLIAAPVPGDTDAMAEVQIESGETLFLPMTALAPQAGGGYTVAVGPAALDGAVSRAGEEVIPLVAETLSVGKREIVTGRVRFTTQVTERVETVDEALFRTEVGVRRVPVGRFVDAAPAVRHEDGVMIVPVLEEVLVTEKRLRLVEEVYISQTREEYHQPQSVTLRTETLSEERLPAERQPAEMS